MSSWPSSKARRVLAALHRIGWTLNLSASPVPTKLCPDLAGPISYLPFTMAKKLDSGC
jgi:hypothetical protein